MIDKKSFYQEDESLSFIEKKKLWHSIQKGVSVKQKNRFWIDLKSFSFGMAFTVIIYFMFVGIKTTVESAVLENTPNLVRVNKAYSEVINDLENNLLSSNNLKYPKLVVDNKIGDNFERIKGINTAISDLEQLMISSSVKQQRLMRLYKIKLEAIEDLILIEEANE